MIAVRTNFNEYGSCVCAHVCACRYSQLLYAIRFIRLFVLLISIVRHASHRSHFNDRNDSNLEKSHVGPHRVE